MAFYGDLKATADGLLARFKQGTVEIGRTVSTPGAQPWDAPTLTTDYSEINAVVRGVSSGMVGGVEVLATDLQLTASIGDYEPRPGDKIRIDGANVTMIRMDKIPAAGITVAWRFIVRA